MDPLLEFIAWGYLAAIVWFLWGPWQDHCIDVARQNLFAARDDLFDLASGDGGISFSDNAYVELREYTNSLIRFSHKMTWVWMAALFGAAPAPRPNPVSSHISSIEDPETRKAVERIWLRVSETTVKLIVSRSPLLALLIGLVLVVHRVSSFIQKSPFTGLRMQVFGVIETETTNAARVEPVLHAQSAHKLNQAA